MYPKGIIIECCCVLLGTNLGSVIKNRVPVRIKQPMNTIFGIAAIAIGVTSLIRLESLPAVIIALILGALIEEGIDLDRNAAVPGADLALFLAVCPDDVISTEM